MRNSENKITENKSFSAKRCILINADEASEVLGVKKCTIYNWIYRGYEHKYGFPVRRSGGKVMFVRDELLEWTVKMAHIKRDLKKFI